MADDKVIDLLRDRIDSVAEIGAKTARSLEDHVKECSRTQRMVLLGVIAILLWLVSPKAAEFLLKVFG